VPSAVIPLKTICTKARLSSQVISPKYRSACLIFARSIGSLYFLYLPATRFESSSIESGDASYSVTDLGTLGGTVSYAYGINANSQVAGYAATVGNAGSDAFLYSSGVMTDLGTLGGSSSNGNGINDSGQVVGFSQLTGNAALHAFLYNGGVMHDLGTLSGGTNSIANSINDSGQVVGGSNTVGNTTPHAFLYSGGSMHDLGTLGGNDSAANSINASGQVAGYSEYMAGNAETCLQARRSRNWLI
jgi:probable HAF family extracellular repeat protein